MIKHSLQIGSIFYSSWGYDQTNIDFYEVTKLIGKCTVELRKIAQSKIPCERDYFCGKTKPIPGKFISDPLRKRLTKLGNINISSFEHASPWEGKELLYSSYA
ncbi:hypothetical protein [Legionella saoudiensis]|uniref:hypothetical protein n=1 Tax=Legionella saoudiensis TaxID=1750561 RepID=UPI00072FD9F6|nr:hypothetical protein [Legionella saoudiensis]